MLNINAPCQNYIFNSYVNIKAVHCKFTWKIAVITTEKKYLAGKKCPLITCYTIQAC